MLSAYSPSLCCTIVLCTMTFLQVEPAIALDDILAQVVPLNSVESSLTEDAPVVFLGHRSLNHYVVIIPTSSLEEARSHLDSIRTKVVPYTQVPYAQKAFVASNILGPYVYAEGFEQRHQANDLLRSLQGEFSRVRLIHFP